MTGEAYREIRTCQVRATDLKVGDVFDTNSADSLGDYDRWIEVTAVGRDDDGVQTVTFEAPPTSSRLDPTTITWRPRQFELVTIQWSYRP